MMAPQPHGMPMSFSNMGLHGLPRTLWDGGMNPVQYPYSLGNGFNDNLIMPPVMMGNQGINPFHHQQPQQQQQQPQHQMGGIFADDQNGMFRTAGSQAWPHNNPVNPTFNPAAQAIYNAPWHSNVQDATYDDVHHQGDAFHDQ